MKPLSEDLSILAGRAKRAEDNFAAAMNEARDKSAERREQTRAEAAATIDKVDTRLQRAKDSASTQWTEFSLAKCGSLAALQGSSLLRDRAVSFDIRSPPAQFWSAVDELDRPATSLPSSIVIASGILANP